jgi:hypothetical protein
MKKILVLFTFLIFLFVISCYYDNEEALYPSLINSCDTTNVTFSRTVVPILSSNCYSCHSNANASFGGNIKLENIADVRINSSKVLAAIKQTGPIPMPPNGKLKDCSINQLVIWIKNGMQK